MSSLIRNLDAHLTLHVDISDQISDLRGKSDLGSFRYAQGEYTGRRYSTDTMQPVQKAIQWCASARSEVTRTVSDDKAMTDLADSNFFCFGVA